MQKEFNSSFLCMNRDRGSNGVVPFLLIFLVVLLAGIPLVLSGCGKESGELIRLDESTTMTAASYDGFKDDGAGNAQENEGGGNADEVNITQMEEEAARSEEKVNEAYEAAGSLQGNDPADKSIYVYICGAVECPDVYELTPENHVVDGIRAAGGFLQEADRNAINLAAKLSDGMKIYVPVIGEAEESVISNSQNSSSFVTTESSSESGTASNETESSGSGLVNINQASKEQLMTLPGIGEGKASKILEYRENNGPFSQNSDIMNVNGIKNGAYEKIKDLICVG